MQLKVLLTKQVKVNIVGTIPECDVTLTDLEGEKENNFVSEVASAADVGRLLDAKLSDQDNTPDGVVFSLFGIIREP